MFNLNYFSFLKFGKSCILLLRVFSEENLLCKLLFLNKRHGLSNGNLIIRIYAKTRKENDFLNILRTGG